MRSYENSGYNPYNDNDRSQSRGSARNYYSDEFDISRGERGAHRLNSNLSSNRRSSDFGSGRDSYASSGYGGTSTYGRSTGSSDWGSSGNRYGSDSSYRSDRNRSNEDWGDRMEDTWDRTKNRVSNAWDRVTGDDDRDRNRYGSGSSYTGRYGSSNDYGTGYTRNYGAGNYGSGSSYGTGSLSSGSSGYGSGTYGTGYTTSNYGSSYGSDRGRYSSDYDRGSSRYSSDYDRDRDRDHDRGFFDKAGDEIKSWFGDDEAERRRRMDEMRDRQHDRDYDSDRYRSSYGSSGSSSYSGPPYSYGSSSRRDYEW